MSAVPDKVLNWLYSILTSEYHDVNTAYSAVAQTLSSYPSLTPRTEVFTDNNGSSALLLLLSGTLPVQFRGSVYRFPIALWVPHAYPVEAPIVFVTPTKEMMLRPGQQHVGMDGQVYHPYLAQWGRYSTILDFLSVLRNVFAKEPPVVARQGQPYVQPNMEAGSPSIPPPVPQLPAELRKPQTQSPVQVQPSGPPPLPPKPGQEPERQDRYAESRPPPPLPPLPSQVSQLRGGPANHRNPGGGPRQSQPVQAQHYPPRQDSWNHYTSNPSFPQTPRQQSQQPHHHELESPVSPISPPENQFQRVPPQRYSQPPPQLTLAQQQYQQHPPPGPSNYNQYAQPPNAYAQTSPQQFIPQNPQNVHQPPTKTTAPNLLDSDLDVVLPSQRADQIPLPVPVVPPNPEKDHLLHTLSSSLHSQLVSAFESNQNALPALQAQSTALKTAYGRLQSEIEELERLDAALATNERILRETMRDADRVIESCKDKKVPDVDDVLVAPTVVGGQLWNLVAEERALEEVRVALQRAVGRGRIGGEVFIKQTRSLAREQFFKKALIKKIARGMGLDAGNYGRGEGFY